METAEQYIALMDQMFKTSDDPAYLLPRLRHLKGRLEETDPETVIKVWAHGFGLSLEKAKLVHEAMGWLVVRAVHAQIIWGTAVCDICNKLGCLQLKTRVDDNNRLRYEVHFCTKNKKVST
jgi:hypothetical protein